MAGGRKGAWEYLLGSALAHSQGLETVKACTVRDTQVLLAVPLQASSSSSPRFFLDRFKPRTMDKKARSGFVQHSHLRSLPLGCEGTCSLSDLGTKSWGSKLEDWRLRWSQALK